MKSTLGVILGGGQGTRLFPLTGLRSKPAVPLAGKYRLIDIPVSNCLNSAVGKIYVLTQFNSVSLHRHIESTYRFDHFSQNFVEILAAMQTRELTDWYQGTADAVRKNLRYINLPEYEHILILSGDQLYQMDFREMMRSHKEQEADVSVAVIPVPRDRAKQFGILQVDQDCWIRNFIEKPQEENVLDELCVSGEQLAQLNIHAGKRSHLASMGIYLFNRQVLVDLLENEGTDFGKEIIPHAIESKRTLAFPFDGYWEDIGTIKAFFQANLSITEPFPEFDFYNAAYPIYTRPRQLPATKIFRCHIDNSVIADGCVIEESDLQHCVIGVRGMLRHHTRLRDTVLMGADYYEGLQTIEENRAKGLPGIGIGAGSEVSGVIIDKNVRIGENVRLVNAEHVQEADGENYSIRDGIIVVPKDAVIPSDTVV